MSDHALSSARAAAPEARRRTHWWSLAWRQYRLERRMFWRNPSAAFFNILLPLLFLGLFGAIFAGEQADLDVIVPGIAGMSVMATTFNALSLNVTFLREQGILKRMRGTPLPASAYLAAIGGSAVANALLQVALVTAAGALFLDVSWPRDWFALALFVIVGVGCFAALGVALAHATPNVEAAPAISNAIFLPAIVISGVFYDDDNAPGVLRDVAEALPLKHLIDGLSGAMVEGRGVGDHLTALLVILLWGALGAVFAVRGFSWEARRSG